MHVLVASLLGALLLGALQGLTEFLPVSSSGHLALAQAFVTVPGDDVFFDLMLHIGTLAPAIWFFWPQIMEMGRDVLHGELPFWERRGVRMTWLVLVASVPTAVMGIGLEDWFEEQFSDLWAVGAGFAISGFWLWGTRSVKGGQLGLMDVPTWMAFVIGVAQGVAISPSISRSGATIATALLLGLERQVAVQLSFLMSIPAIAGAVLLSARKADLSTVVWPEVALGTFTSLVVGYASLVLLVRLVQRGQIAWFAWYLWVLAAASFAAAWLS